MGRCYEFGIVLGEGCEHAMVVPESGRRCECATCDVTCAGKFAACAAILDQAGYVPVTAPAWAVAVGTVGPALGTGPVPVTTGPQEAPMAAPDRLAALAALIETVTKRLAEHDIDLATRMDALSEQIGALQRQSAQQAAGLRAVVAELADLMKRAGEAAPGPLLGYPRGQP